MLDVAQFLLDFLDLLVIAGVLTHVVAELHGRATIGSGDLDDDIEWLGLFSAGGVDKII